MNKPWQIPTHRWTGARKRLWESRAVWLTAPIVAGLVLSLRSLGWLQPYSWMALDQFFRSRPAETPDSRIVIVEIAETDLRQLKRWPIDDGTLATALQKIRQKNPTVIGLDLHRDFPIEPGHQSLVEVFKTTSNLIGIEKRGGREDIPVAPPPALKALSQVACNDVVMDQDGKIRRGLLYWTSPDGKDFQECLGMRLALDYLATQQVFPEAEAGTGYLKLGKTIFRPFKENDGGYAQADAGGYQTILNFRGASRTFHRISVMDILQDRVPAEMMRDRIVLIGPTAYSIKDLFHTPYSGNSLTTPETMPGVEIQANIASQVISSALEDRSGIQVWTVPAEWAWVLLWAFIGAALGWVPRSLRWAIASMMATLGSLVLICYVAFLAGWWIPLIPPALAMMSSAGILTTYIAYLERAERRTIMNIFGRHVTPEIAEAIWRDRNQILRQGRLMGRRMTATVLFTDLKDFSSVSERIPPEHLMSWLNEYMEAMTQVVLEHGGIVDKFIGDSIMAVFGVPIPRTTSAAIAQDAHQAISCAIRMASVLEALNARWDSQSRPTTSMRVGIATGPVVTGSLGGQQRIDYTTIGDCVNVASRLEGYDKTLSPGLCRILISETTYEFVQDQLPIQFIATVQLKGRSQITKIYQILLESSQNTL